MGYHNELKIDKQEMQSNNKLSEILGISLDELDELEFVIKTDSNEDNLIFNYRVEFDTVNSNIEILKKIKNLSDGCRIYLQPYELNEDFYYEEEIDAINQTDNHLKKFNKEILNLKSLLTIEPNSDELKRILNRQIFISAIGTMETFLSEIFLIKTFNKTENLKRFIGSHPFFKQSKFELRDIFKEYEQIEETAKKVILDTIFHNLPVVSNMYKTTFGIEFPSIKNMYKNVSHRHDLVHRNGKTKEGKDVSIEDADIIKLIEELNTFILEIATSFDL